MSMAKASDEGLRIDILLLLLKEGPLTREILIRRLGIGPNDYLDWNLRRLGDLILSSDDKLDLTEDGKRKVRIEILKNN